MTAVMGRTLLLVYPKKTSEKFLPTCFTTTNLNFSAKNLVKNSPVQVSRDGDTSHRWCGKVQLKLDALLSTALDKVFRKLVPPQYSLCATMALQVSLFKASNH